MLSNYLSLLIIPQKDGNIFHIRLSGLLLKIAISVFAFIILGSLIVIFDYIKIREKGQQQVELDKKRLLQTFELKEINNRLNHNREALQRYEDFDRKLRLISGLQDTVSQIQFVGKINILTRDSEDFVDGRRILQKLRQLDVDIKNREISFFQLEAYLQESKDRLARTPSISPTRGHFSSGFGMRRDPFTRKNKFHKGVDWSNRPYTPIYAPADGVVVNTFINGGYGMFLVIDHGYNVVTRYGHLAKYEVSVGERVKRGDLIGRMGNSGRSTATHLHYEVLVRDQHVDPIKYILE